MDVREVPLKSTVTWPSLIGIMPVILVKLIMACSGSGALLLRRWC